MDVINFAADRQKFMTLTGELIKLTAPETISRFRDIGRYRRFNLPHLSLAPPLGVTPLEFR